MRVGDLVQWKATGKVCIYLGLYDEMQCLYSYEYGIIERLASRTLDYLIEVISENR